MDIPLEDLTSVKEGHYKVPKWLLNVLAALFCANVVTMITIGIGMYIDVQILKSTMGRIEASMDKFEGKAIILDKDEIARVRKAINNDG